METVDSPDPSEVTRILELVATGEEGAAHRLLPLVYDQLRAIAHRRRQQLGAGQTLQTTALVHEAWVKLSVGEDGKFAHRAHFFGAAARAMRNLLVDAARRRSSRRDHGAVDVEEVVVPAEAVPPGPDLLALDEALSQLEQERPRAAQVVMMRYFAGLGLAEIAEILQVASRTIDREWAYAKSWLYWAIEGRGSAGRDPGPP